MRKPPYHEIINLKIEQKEYGRLCCGKSKQFTLYSEWEDHIKGILADFRSSKDLYNFKHYCINIARSQEKSPEMFWCYIGFLIPIYIDTLWKDFPPILTVAVFIAVFAYAALLSKKIARESCFFRDIIDIIESMEKT